MKILGNFSTRVKRLILALVGILSILFCFSYIEGTEFMNKKSTVSFRDIVIFISKNVQKPEGLGYEKGVDVSKFFEEKINSYSDYKDLISDLNNSNFYTKTQASFNDGKEIIEVKAIYNFHTNGIVRRVDSSVIINIIITEGSILKTKAVYFNDINI